MEELYNICEALGSLRYLDYEEWIDVMEWIIALKGLGQRRIEDEVISWCKSIKERKETEDKENKVVE